jgi:hypothetical protein
MQYWTITIANRYILSIHYQETPKKFGGPRGYNWSLRDQKYFRNIILPGMNGSWVTLEECKRRSKIAFLVWFTLKLMRNTKDPKIIDPEAEWLRGGPSQSPICG